MAGKELAVLKYGTHCVGLEFFQAYFPRAQLLAVILVSMFCTLPKSFAQNQVETQPVVRDLPADFRLVWSDEFDGVALDNSKWSPRGDGPRRGGVISADCVFVDGNGHLVIETRKVGDSFHSGMISTDRSFRIKYGYFEARILFPRFGGQNSGFWLQSPGNARGEGPPRTAGAEIDIIEFYRGARGGWASSGLHWGGYAENHKKQSNRKLFDDANDWHTYSLLWTDSGYTFYTDGVQTWHTDRAVSHVPEYMILSTVIGQRSKALETATLPDRMLVDYVRVFTNTEVDAGND